MSLFKGTTNGGANRVFVKDGDVVIGGQAVAGRKSLDADLIADVWGGELLQSGTLKAGSNPNDINDATISIVEMNGAGSVFEMLAEVGTGLGNAGQVERGVSPAATASAIEGKISDIGIALDRAKIVSDGDGNYEVQFSGLKVAGAVATNGDFTESEAEDFLAKLRDTLELGSGYKVVVSDDDLEGDFEFFFEDTWYRDVNAKKLGMRLEESDVVSDGEISSKAEGAAANLALFLEQMSGAGGAETIFEKLEDKGTGLGNKAQVEKGVAGAASAEAISTKITDLTAALDKAKVVQEADGQWEIQFSGQGVKGAVTTNGDFKTEGKAEDFLEHLTLFESGFLDDVLL